MAEAEGGQLQDKEEDVVKKLAASSYIGLSFSLFLALLPRNTLSLVPSLQTQVKELNWKLFHAEEQLRQMKSRRKEDFKANARVVEIFASHRNAWQEEEKRLLHQIDAAAEEITHLRAKVAEFEKFEGESRARIEELEREVGERDEMINFMTRRNRGELEAEQQTGRCRSGDLREGRNTEWFQKDMEACMSGVNRNRNLEEENNFVYENGYPFQQEISDGFNPEFLSSASKFWAERATLWQDVQYEPFESLCEMKHFVARRESPWKVDGESTGISSKLKLLEQELLNLEKIGKTDLSKVPSMMRKQAKRYQALAGKIDDLCRRMQANDPCEPTLTTEFRTQRQTEFLLEAFRLQQRASETGQKLVALQTEIGKNYCRDELGSQAVPTTRRSLDSIRNNLKEVQRNLEIWLARIIGDLEGNLARDGASRVREYCISRYPFVQ